MNRNCQMQTQRSCNSAMMQTQRNCNSAMMQTQRNCNSAMMQTQRNCNSAMMQRGNMPEERCVQNSRMKSRMPEDRCAQNNCMRNHMPYMDSDASFLMQHHANHEAMNQQQLLRHISEASFAVDDILLYLDTHPYDEEALKYAHQMICMQNDARSVYARKFGPLTVDMTCERDCDYWEWVMQPWPWESMCQKGGR